MEAIAHVVHIAAAYEDLPEEVVETEADESDPRPKGTVVTGRRYVGPVSCPDCGSGLSSQGTYFSCLMLPPGFALVGEQEGDIVACGLTAAQRRELAAEAAQAEIAAMRDAGQKAMKEAVAAILREATEAQAITDDQEVSGG